MIDTVLHEAGKHSTKHGKVGRKKGGVIHRATSVLHKGGHVAPKHAKKAVSKRTAIKA